MDISDFSPGPASYDVRKKYTSKNGFTLKSRINQSVKNANSPPPPGSYDPKYEIVENSKFKKITFGVGPRPEMMKLCFKGM